MLPPEEPQTAEPITFVAADDRAAAAAFYAAPSGGVLWLSKEGFTARAQALAAEIRNAADWGLDPAAFPLPALSAAPLTEQQQAKAEIELTLAALAYARHARGGRIEQPNRQLSSYLDRRPQVRDPRIVMAELAQAPDAAAYLRAQHPRHPQFEKLRQRYLELRKSSGAPSDIVLIPAGPKIKPGTRHPHVALVRQRLKMPAAAGADETLFDPALVAAVKEFQKSKGQSGDGWIGSATRAAMNDVELPGTDRVLANMEMYRWLPDALGDFYITVNIPEFKFRIVKGGAVIHEERVITGLPDKQTPVFSDELETVTFHPRWNVPNSIKVRELYPSLARGGTYVQKQGIKITYAGRPVDPDSVDWYSADIRKFEVFQPPGPNNVLGHLKFSFPNHHEVYMHDTNTRNLFEAESRPFSHGCMRVRNPERLAEIVLGADKGWDGPRIAEMLATQPVENPIKLDRKVPVHVTYFTVVIGEDGKERLMKDVYGHEQRVRQALEGRWEEIAVGTDHLAPVKYAEDRGGGNALEAFFGNLFGGF